MNSSVWSLKWIRPWIFFTSNLTNKCHTIVVDYIVPSTSPRGIMKRWMLIIWKTKQFQLFSHLFAHMLEYICFVLRQRILVKVLLPSPASTCLFLTPRTGMLVLLLHVHCFFFMCSYWLVYEQNISFCGRFDLIKMKIVVRLNRLAANLPLLEHVLEPSSLFIKSSNDDGFGSDDTYKYALFADVPKLD